MKKHVKLKEDVVCRDGNIIPAGIEFAVNEDGPHIQGKYHCFSLPDQDDQYLAFITKEKLEVIGEVDADMNDFFREYIEKNS